MLNERLRELARKYLGGHATEEEIAELHRWYEQWQDDEEVVLLQNGDTEDSIQGRILSELQAKMHSETEQPAPVRPLRKRYRVAIAAAVLITVGLGLVKLLTYRGDKVPVTAGARVLPPADVPAPSASKAMIVLADGRQLPLDKAEAGTLAREGNVQLVKTTDGQIVYRGNAGAAEQFNTLYNPRGSKVISLVLSDGTRVWLNAESSLRYPVAFTGTGRQVEITGEAYFEVTHNPARPFIVQKGDMRVTVLGTHFNVNTYEDEENIQVTLLEGSVKVNKGAATGWLRPGQQAKVASDVHIVDDVNLEEVMAWKNGKFQFGEASDIQTIMKQVARWYDMDVEYRGVVRDHIGGTISREASASQVFRMLELTGVVSFEINGKKVVVMPK